MREPSGSPADLRFRRAFIYNLGRARDYAGRTVIIPASFKRPIFIFGILLCMLSIGCGTEYYKKSADTEVYGIIDDKSQDIEGMPSEFTIEPREEPFWGENETVSPLLLTLADSLEIAVKNSRTYQSRRERLYSQGLSLSLARNEFSPIFSGSASTEIERQAQRNSVSQILSFGVSKMLETGADLSLSITTNLFRYLSGDPAKTASSTLSASLVQPLLKGAGRKVALENLTQEERDMVYAIRDFVRFRKTFSVNIAKSYFNTFQQKDQLANTWNNYSNLEMERKRAELMAQAGRLPEFQVDQTKQDELRAWDRWIRAKTTYENSLDAFKLDLGVPTDIAIELDLSEMANLSGQGIIRPEVTLADATTTALEDRLDLKNTRDRAEDASRKVTVAANALKPGLDLTGSILVDTKGDTKPFDFDFDNASYSAGIDVELPLERTAERNVYRQALINQSAAKRDFVETIDEVKLGVRNALRNLDQAEQSYRIQTNSLTLAEQRVESTSLLQQAGRASTRDVLEAREALLEAQNQVTRALVEHFNARLDLFLATERLRIDDHGLWIREDDIGS